MNFMKEFGKEWDEMFKFLSLRERLQIEEDKNKLLQLKIEEQDKQLQANLIVTRKLVKFDELSEKELIEIVNLYDGYKEDHPYEKGDIFKLDDKLYEVTESHTSEKENPLEKSSKLYKNVTTVIGRK